MEQMNDQMEMMRKEMEQMRKQLEENNQPPNQDGDLLVGVVKLMVGAFLIAYALFTFL